MSSYCSVRADEPWSNVGDSVNVFWDSETAHAHTQNQQNLATAANLLINVNQPTSQPHRNTNGLKPAVHSLECATHSLRILCPGFDDCLATDHPKLSKTSECPSAPHHTPTTIKASLSKTHNTRVHPIRRISFKHTDLRLKNTNTIPSTDRQSLQATQLCTPRPPIWRQRQTH